MAKIPYKTYLTEEEMPKQWYNLRADMKEAHDPMLNPGTLEPMKAQDLYHVLPDILIFRRKSRIITAPSVHRP